MLIDDVDAPDELNNLDFESIDFDDDVGLALNAGLGIKLTDHFGLTLDAKYVRSNPQPERCGRAVRRM